MRLRATIALLLSGCAAGTEELIVEVLEPPVRPTRIEACEVHGERAQEHLADVRRWALDAAEPSPPSPVAEPDPALWSTAERARVAWQFHVSPEVLVGEVVGHARLDTAIIGRGVPHRVVARFRGDSAARALQLDHTSLPSHCGDRWIIGADTADGPREPPPASCDIRSDSERPSTDDRARLPDTTAARADVWDWLEASEPAYRTWAPEDDPSAIRYATPRPPWADEPSLDEALALATHVATLTVDEVSSDGEVHDVLVIIHASDDFPSTLGRSPEPRRLRFTCGDPRLLERGARWTVLIATADYHPDLDRGYLVPGVMLPDAPWVPQALRARRDQLRHLRRGL